MGVFWKKKNSILEPKKYGMFILQDIILIFTLKVYYLGVKIHCLSGFYVLKSTSCILLSVSMYMCLHL